MLSNLLFYSTLLFTNHDCSGRSTQVQNGDYWLQKVDNSHKSVNRLNWFCLAYDFSHQIWILYYFVFSSNEISKTLNPYISKLVLWHLSTSSTTVFNWSWIYLYNGERMWMIDKGVPEIYLFQSNDIKAFLSNSGMHRQAWRSTDQQCTRSVYSLNS